MRQGEGTYIKELNPNTLTSDTLHCALLAQVDIQSIQYEKPLKVELLLYNPLKL